MIFVYQTYKDVVGSSSVKIVVVQEMNTKKHRQRQTKCLGTFEKVLVPLAPHAGASASTYSTSLSCLCERLSVWI